MAIESPLFQSAMELLGHSLSHYSGAKELDRKLVILHLANAVELLLKDLVLESGQSIYKAGNSKETITIHQCIENLTKNAIVIPYQNKLELLIDERNALQHRFGSPNELTTFFYVNIAIGFFKEMIENNYAEDFDEIIKQYAEEKDLVAIQMQGPNNNSELSNLYNLSKIHPLGAFLSVMAYYEKIVSRFLESLGVKDGFSTRLGGSSPRILREYGIDFSEDIEGRLLEIRRFRNLAMHKGYEPTKEDVSRAIKTVEEVESILKSLDIKQLQLDFFQKQQEKELENKRQFELVDGTLGLGLASFSRDIFTSRHSRTQRTDDAE